MYFACRLIVVILLILYLKLNSAHTATLIEHHKSVIINGNADSINETINDYNSHNSGHNSGNGDNGDNDDNTNNNKNKSNNSNNNNKTDNDSNANATRNGRLSKLLLLTRGSSNNYTDNAQEQRSEIAANADSATIADDKASNADRIIPEIIDISQVISSNSDQNYISKIKNATKYFYYNILHGSSKQPTTTTTTTSPATTNTVTLFTLPRSTLMNATTSTPSDNLNSTVSAEDAEHWQRFINNSDIESFLLRYKSDGGNECLMDDIRDLFMWWAFANGTLNTEELSERNTGSGMDFSYQNFSDDESLFKKVKFRIRLRAQQIVAFSAAYNNLTHVPYKTLTLMNDTLRFLSLKGNQFAAYTTEQQIDTIGNFIHDTNQHDGEQYSSDIDFIDNIIHELDSEEILQEYDYPYQLYRVFSKKEGGIAWATFPPMHELLELDISNCHIEFLTSDVFQNLTNLRRLFIAHNKMLTIPHDTFMHVPLLRYLDLSYTNGLDFDYQIPLPTLDAVVHLIYGVKIQPTTFKDLTELVYLDMSHTKITRNSAMAFTHLGEKMQYLSLCYTGFPMVGNALFKGTGLIGLDLSGNPSTSFNMLADAFESVSDTLMFLYFEQSNLKDLSWLKYLVNLRVLGLAGNNINSISEDSFGALQHLQVLDLSSNHVGNWYNSAFNKNKNLRVLNLRDNNINIINPEMLKDFEQLDYLSLGDNNFVCDCLLHDLIEIAAANNQQAQCSENVLHNAQELLVNNSKLMKTFVPPNATRLAQHAYGKVKEVTVDTSSSEIKTMARALTKRFGPKLQQSYQNLRRYNQQQHRFKLRFITRYLKRTGTVNDELCSTPQSVHNSRFNGSTLKFQLLDYEDEHYWCFNETQRMHFVQISCQTRSFSDNLENQLHTLTKYVVASVCSIVGLTILSVVLYLKRWHIYYYYSSIKSAALMSVATKESVNKFNELSEQDPNLVYDIFISYCQNDRQWVLEELLPNVEEAGNISICLHERDFQIGVTILDNIISCMDRSRALMLIISSNFLLSHWCQFEMHLAQHRIFEVSKEHLIIVFLEDIPRSKRPKTLQYLMEVKTYIKWPGAKGNKPVKPEESKLFWKRLKRSLEHIGVPATESHA